MSKCAKCHAVSVVEQVSNILEVADGVKFLSRAGNIIHKLIESSEVKQLLENKDVGENSVNSFAGVFSSIKLILEVGKECLERDKISSLDISLQEILQTIRDLVEVAVQDTTFPRNSVFSLVSDVITLLYEIVAVNCVDRDVNQLASFYQYNIYMVKVKYASDKIENEVAIFELTLRLRIIATIITSILDIIGKNDGKFLTIYKDKLLENDIQESIRDPVLLSQLVTTHCDGIALQTLLTIIPNYVSYSRSNSVLQQIWDLISCHITNEDMNNGSNIGLEGNLGRSLLILCYLSDLYFSQSSSSEDLLINLLSDEKYWILIQSGLVNHDAIIRKQALFLCKKSIEEVRKTNHLLSCHKRDELNVCNFDQKLTDGVLKLKNGMKNFLISNNKIFLVHNDTKNIFWWDATLSNELYAVYQDIFLIIETLEEKQVHLVKPVLNIVSKVAETSIVPFRNGKAMSISWLIVMFQRILSHNNISIVKWGMLNLLKIPIDVILNESAMKRIIQLLTSGLNNINLYFTEQNIICGELKEYFMSVSQTSSAKQFFKILIHEMCNLTWCPEALYHVVFALCCTPKCHVWQTDELLTVKHFVVSSIGTHYTPIRAGTQCCLLTCIANMTDTTTVHLETIADVLGGFRREESLQRNSAAWKKIISWLEFCYSKKNAEEFILNFILYNENKRLESQSIAKMIVLLHDAHLFGVMQCCGETPSCNIINILSSLLASFKDCDKRCYADRTIQEYYLNILFCILAENMNTLQPEETRLVEMMLPYCPDIVRYIHSRLQHVSDLAEYSTTQVYVNMFEAMLKSYKLFRVDSTSMVKELFVELLDLLDEARPASSLQRYLGMKLLRLVVEHVYIDKTIPKLRVFQKYFRNQVNTPLVKSDVEATLTRDVQKWWGKMNSEYLEAKWYLLERLKNENICHMTGGVVTVDQFINPNELVLVCLEAVEVGGYNVLLPVLTVLQDLISDISNGAVLSKVAEMIWICTLERRKTEGFWVAISKFVQMLFQQELIAKQNPVVVELLLEYTRKIFSANIPGLVSVLIHRLQQLGVKYSLSPVFREALALSLLYGPVQRKDERLTAEVCSLIEEQSMSARTSDFGGSAEVRARAVQILLTLDRTQDGGGEDHRRFAGEVLDALLIQHDVATKNRWRYFNDSLTHRVKHRLMQALLLLEPYLHRDKSCNMAEWLCKNMVNESRQPSVRYLEEWLLVRLIVKYSELKELFWKQFSEGLEKRVGSLCSFMSVAYHTARLLEGAELEAWLDKTIHMFLPHCMAQHFSVRLYGQVIVEKLWQLSLDKAVHHVVEKYRLVHECLVRSIAQGNSVKNCAKLEDDFYFTVFHPVQHYTLQALYTDLPRLANVGQDEWVTPQILLRCGVTEATDPTKRIPVVSRDDALGIHLPASWTLRTEEGSREGGPIAENEASNFQKKMIPLKTIIPDRDDILEVLDAAPNIGRRKTNIKTGGLVVVASLIDKAPNLGGLGRTCEVFGVSEYVLGSLKYVEDKQFQSLSVTAEKWLNMTEVKPHVLSDYLIRMKEQGYVIVGAEQTAKSQPLDKVKFPRQSLLLLGNEKEGIPAQLLPLLDICVEVPQLGVVRSLNVHVTGALFIWEYARQHSLGS